MEEGWGEWGWGGLRELEGRETKEEDNAIARSRGQEAQTGAVTPGLDER